PPGLQAEAGASIIQQVELGIAAAFDELRLFVFRREGQGLAALHQREIGFLEAVADLLHEGPVGGGVAAVQIIKENAADAARFVPVRKVEVLIAPFAVLSMGALAVTV